MKNTKDRAPKTLLPYILRIFIFNFKEVSRVSTGFWSKEEDSIYNNLFCDGKIYLKDTDDLFGNGLNLYPVVYPFFWLWIQLVGLMMILVFALFKTIILAVFIIQFAITFVFAIMLTIASIVQLIGRLFIRKDPSFKKTINV